MSFWFICGSACFMAAKSFAFAPCNPVWTAIPAKIHAAPRMRRTCRCHEEHAYACHLLYSGRWLPPARYARVGQRLTSLAGQVMQTPILQSWLISRPWSMAASRMLSPSLTSSVSVPPSCRISTCVAPRMFEGTNPLIPSQGRAQCAAATCYQHGCRMSCDIASGALLARGECGQKRPDSMPERAMKAESQICRLSLSRDACQGRTLYAWTLEHQLLRRTVCGAWLAGQRSCPLSTLRWLPARALRLPDTATPIITLPMEGRLLKSAKTR